MSNEPERVIANVVMKPLGPHFVMSWPEEDETHNMYDKPNEDADVLTGMVNHRLEELDADHRYMTPHETVCQVEVTIGDDVDDRNWELVGELNLHESRQWEWEDYGHFEYDE